MRYLRSNKSNHIFNIFRNNKFIVLTIILLSLAIGGCSIKEEIEEVKNENLEMIYELLEIQGIDKEYFDKEFQINKNMYGEDILDIIHPGTEMSNRDYLAWETADDIIMEKKILEDARIRDIGLSEKEKEIYIEKYIEDIGGEEAVEELLEHGDISKEYFLHSLEKMALREKHKNEMLKELEIDPDYAKEFFEENREGLIQVKAKHILVKTEKEANEILEKISSGEDFSELAKKHSIDKTSSIYGGDLGYFARGSNPKEFEDVAFEMDIDEIKGPIKTQLGFDIIKLEDKKVEYEELKEDVIKVMEDIAYNSMVLEWE